ncbi:amidohydrolase family protein [Tenggerimyces flavus]|uniref:Amidohydrolase family protein n=1 Tax=Tenggerimyces flavus TaxID=1708749 RepID=A0ABV7YJ06_9ACTN|nr:amidohydrolase family protein [Tenggerimyces flavus]MBM7786744.1 imidazolonepropionase-like amidohydrolase [Tenggerimyces flavus]
MTDVLHVRGVVLPEGIERDLYVVDGRITFSPAASAVTVADRGWIVPGLVDAHCHIGLDAQGAVSPEKQVEQAELTRDTGTLLVRDAGSAADTRWLDGRLDLPRIVRAGRHIARPRRYIRNYAVEVEPVDLVAAVAEQAVRGDGWVKLVGDWIDRDRGDLAPLWPGDVLSEAITRAHSLGARVTAHVFGTEAMPDLVAAGIDCLEHGVGLTPDLIDAMAARGTALVPTRLQVGRFPEYAARGEERFPAYAKHMLTLHARSDAMLAAAYEAGVPIYAGTDAGGELPHGLIAAEIQAMAALMSPFDALAAGSWRAREWLGLNPMLSEGAPADFVVYETDPLTDLRVLSAPSRLVLRGAVIR